jgi:hypothetical protein
MITRLVPTITAKQRSGMRVCGKKRERAQARENVVAVCPEGKEVSPWEKLKKEKLKKLIP